MKRFLVTNYRWIRREPVWLASALIIVGSLWGFLKLASDVNAGDTQSFDEWVVTSLRTPDDLSQLAGPDWLDNVARDITALGGVIVLAMLTFLTAGFLMIRRGYRLASFLILVVVTGTVVGLYLKRLFDRPRPEIVPHLADVSLSSFPSGHAMMSAIVYLTLAAIVSATMTKRIHKTYVFANAFLIVGLVGASRVYLGVHYPTDVLAGWAAGILWALVAWAMLHWLQSRHSVEQPAAVPDLNQ